jgi:NUMOD3 motif
MIWQVARLAAVTEFARAIGCDWLGEIAVSADASCDENTCHANVDRYILSHGGTRVLGYYMLESAWGYQAILHSVWDDDRGNLIDITPFADQRRMNVFAKLRDNQPLYKTNNIYSQSLDKYVQEIDVMYYVYALIDPRTEVPFYIGKGKGRRAKTHLWEIPETRNEHKENKIAAIRAAGLEPRIEYIAEDIPDESYAYKIEEDLIQKYGRKGYEPYGILTNICLSARPPNHRGKSYVDIYGPERAIIERRKRQELQIARGGYGPKQHSAETKAKISQRSTGAGNGMYGRTLSDETKQKIRENRTPVTGADHPLSRHWQLIAPDGTLHERVGNLQALCDSVGISFATMAAAFRYNRIPNRGKARGWQVKVIK